MRFGCIYSLFPLALPSVVLAFGVSVLSLLFESEASRQMTGPSNSAMMEFIGFVLICGYGLAWHVLVGISWGDRLYRKGVSVAGYVKVGFLCGLFYAALPAAFVFSSSIRDSGSMWMALATLVLFAMPGVIGFPALHAWQRRAS